MNLNKISIVVPTYNEEGNILYLLQRIDNALTSHHIEYEVIFIDDHSTDKTREVIKHLEDKYPIFGHFKQGKKGKAFSLLEGFKHATADLICMIDADLQYPPEAIPAMMKKIEKGADIVIANRLNQKVSSLRKFTSGIFSTIFGKWLFGFDCDIQSGLKVFKKEITERFSINPSPWTFDLEFLIKARDAGYLIESVDIEFAKRYSGSPKLSVIKASFELGFNALKLKFQKHQLIPFHPNTTLTVGHGFHYKGKRFIHHSDLTEDQIAFKRVTPIQILFGVELLLIFLLGLNQNWHLTIVLLIAVLTMFYFSDLLFNLYLIYRSFSKPKEITISEKELRSMQDYEWPRYTILCPLYKEWQVLPQFVQAMSKLDYPKDKLQVMLLLEENDKETVAQAKRFNLPSYFDIVIVPHSFPKTKPKACNYGLKFTTGEYLVIYDAEDVPDIYQLKKAVIAFNKVSKKTICIQAKLNFYNPHQNLLTRLFTAEYSLWFDLVLTGLHSINAIIPLGGTSNHFKTHYLKAIKGWDSFNVTEDCDLGIRLVKNGYTTAVMDSVTLEEANSSPVNWFWQRSRWIKGYMQTYLLHMRHPKEFLESWRQPHVITFQLIVGGKVMSMFINPLMWAITISYFLFRAHIGSIIESFFPAPVFYMGVTSLIFGNFLYMYYYMIGCYKHGHHELVKYVVFVPFYWLAMSMAAWIALYKLITAPHHWSKTKHGLHLINGKANQQTNETINNSLSDRKGASDILPLPALNKL